MRRILLIAAVGLALVVCGTASATIIPFKQAVGVRLGMTLPQAKTALDPSCPTLTSGTRRTRSRYRCYFDVFSARGGWTELTYASRDRRCGADILLKSGSVVEAGGTCNDTLRNGVGIGATFKRMYASFPKGSVRCADRVEDAPHTCIAQHRAGRRILLTEFSDDQADANLVVGTVTVKRCTHIDRNPRAGTRAFMPCTTTFLTTQRRVRGEFTP